MGYGSFGYALSETGLDSLLMLGNAFNSFGSLISLALYLLLGFGLYIIAQRRQIRHAWLAFVPIANVWILGSIADQYDYVRSGAVRSRRKLLLFLEIARVALVLVLIVSIIGNLVQLILNFGGDFYYDALDILYMVIRQLLASAWIWLTLGILSLVTSIFQWICYHALFASCEPENKVLFLVLGIIFSFLMPIFVFICRNKDEGMPPRTSP